MNTNEDKIEINDDEDDISVLIRQSAINKKNPGLFSDSKNIEDVIVLSKFQNIKNNFLEKIDDFITAKIEEYRIKYNKGSSERALKETLDYYRSLYISKNPDLDKLYKLINRNKIIDFPNQYVFGTYDYFEFHESGTLAMEINTILSHVVNKHESFFNDSEKEKIKMNRNKQWMSLEQSNESNLLEEEENEKIRYELAVKSWIMIISFSHDVSYLKRNIHPDNIELATIDCLMNFPEGKYIDKEKFLAGIRRLRVADEKIINGILNKKENRKANFEKRLENNSSSQNSQIHTQSVKADINKIPSLKELKNKRGQG